MLLRLRKLFPWALSVFVVVSSLGLVESLPIKIAYSENQMIKKWSSSKLDGEVISKDELVKTLSPLQYSVTQEDATERPFSNEYWDNKKAGIYVDLVSGEPLFSSDAKFDSGTGWPSFFKPLSEEFLKEHEDFKMFVKRVEVRSKLGDSHLGHVFDDGPKPTGKRYCMNSASLRFIPVQDMEKEGYGEFLKDVTKR